MTETTVAPMAEIERWRRELDEVKANLDRFRDVSDEGLSDVASPAQHPDSRNRRPQGRTRSSLWLPPMGGHGKAWCCRVVTRHGTVPRTSHVHWEV